MKGPRRNSYQKPPPNAPGPSVVTPPSKGPPHDVYQDLTHGTTGSELPTYQALRQRSGEEFLGTSRPGVKEYNKQDVKDDLYVNTAMGAW